MSRSEKGGSPRPPGITRILGQPHQKKRYASSRFMVGLGRFPARSRARLACSIFRIPESRADKPTRSRYPLTSAISDFLLQGRGCGAIICLLVPRPAKVRSPKKKPREISLAGLYFIRRRYICVKLFLIPAPVGRLAASIADRFMDLVEQKPSAAVVAFRFKLLREYLLEADHGREDLRF